MHAAPPNCPQKLRTFVGLMATPGADKVLYDRTLPDFNYCSKEPLRLAARVHFVSRVRTNMFKSTQVRERSNIYSGYASHHSARQHPPRAAARVALRMVRTHAHVAFPSSHAYPCMLLLSQPETLASSEAHHITMLLRRAEDLVARLRAPQPAAVTAREEHEALLIHQLLVEAAARLPPSQTVNRSVPAARLLVPTQALPRMGSAPLESVLEVPEQLVDSEQQQQQPAPQKGHHKRERSIQFHQDDRSRWADSLAQLVNSIVAPAS